MASQGTSSTSSTTNTDAHGRPLPDGATANITDRQAGKGE